MYRARDWYDSADSVTRVVALVAFLILLIITLPVLTARVPALANGVSCSSLSISPGNGSNQSLFKPDINALRLELFTQDAYTQGLPLTFDVRFTNDSAAPMILPFAPGESVFRYTGSENGGLMFFVQSMTNGQVLGEPANVRNPIPARQQYPPDVLRILTPHQRCTQTITVEPERVRAAGVGTGQYRIVAVYRNTQKGVLGQVGALTPTPVFRDQGAYTTPQEGIRSNTALVTINPSGAAR